MRREREANVRDRGEGRDDERGGRGNAFVQTFFIADGGFLPRRAHAHGIFADGNRDAEGGTEIEADGGNGGVKIGTVASDGGRGHPVGRKVNFAEVTDLGGGEVGEGFTDGEAGGSGGVVDGDGSAFAHGHGFAGVDVEGGGGDGAVGHGDLPRADHLVAGNQTAERAVADGNEERLVAHRRVREDALHDFEQREFAEVEGFARTREGDVGAGHARRFAEEHVERQIDRGVFEMGIFEDEFFFGRGFADDGERAALAFAERLERGEASRGDGEDVALLGFVAPNLEWRQARLGVGDSAELEFAAAAAVVDEFGQGVGDAAGADIVDERNGVFGAEGPAAVDDLLAATFHFRVVALDAGEIEIFAAGAAGHGAGGATAEADQHRRSAEDDELIAGVDGALLDVFGLNVAEAAGEHDGLVVAAEFGAAGVGHLLLECAEITVEGGTAKFVVEGCAAERAFEHDVEGGDDAAGFAEIFFPRLNSAGEFEVGDGETDEAGFGFRAAARGAFVADLAAGAGGGAGKRGDRGGMIVRLDLAEDVDVFFVRGVFTGLRVDVKTSATRACEYGGVVLVGGKNALGMERVRVLDHLEQRQVLRLTVDGPSGVENLVAAVFGVGLREHHQLDVVRIAAERGERVHEVVDLVVGEGESEGLVSGDERGAAGGEDRDALHRARRLLAEQRGAGLEFAKNRLGHAIVEFGAKRLELCGRERGRRAFGVGGEFDRVSDDAFDAGDLAQAADAGDVGGLGRPRRNRARTGGDDLRETGHGLGRAAWAVGQELRKYGVGCRRELGSRLDDVDELRADGANGQAGAI